jgi:hypothetical protein
MAQNENFQPAGDLYVQSVGIGKEIWWESYLHAGKSQFGFLTIHSRTAP